MNKKDELREELYGVVQHAELGHYDKPWDAVDGIMQLIDTYTERIDLEARFDELGHIVPRVMWYAGDFPEDGMEVRERRAQLTKQLQNKSIDGGK